MKRNILIILLTIVFVLPSLAQNIEYSNTLPTASFRSTSAMMGVCSAYSSAPALNADGTAAFAGEYDSPAKTSRPRRIGPDVDPEPEEKDKVPVGEGMWVMMLLAVGYAMYRRRKMQAAEE